MAGVSIPVEVVLLAQEALKDFTKFSKEVTSGVATMEGAFKALQAVAAVALVGKGFAEIISAAEEGDAAIRKLNTSMKLAGNFTDEASKSFIELADNIERTSGIQDSTTVSLIAQAQALGFTNQETVKLTNASVDVAAVLGTDVNTAFSDLAKTMSGTLPRGLSKLFPELRNLSKEALVNGDAVSLLANRFQGAGATLNQSFGGAVNGIELAFEQIAKGIGNLIVQNPILIGFLNDVKNALFDASEVVKQFADQFNQLTLADFERGLRLAASAVVAFLVVFKFDAIAAVPGLLKELATGFKGVGIAAKAGALGVNILKAALTLGVTLALDQIISVFTDFDSITDGLKSKFLVLKSIFEEIASLIISATSSLITFVGKIPKLGSLFDTSGTAKNLDALSASLQVNAKQNRTLAESYKSATDEAVKQTAKLGNASVKASDERKKATQQEIDLINFQIQQQQSQIVSAAAQNPFKALSQDQPRQLAELKQKGASDAQIKQTKDLSNVAGALGTFGQVLQGPQGAINILTQVSSLIPGIGGVIGQIAGVLAQGPAAAAGFVTGFINAIPTIITNIITSLPVVIEALVNGLIDLPFKLADSLGQALPDVIGRLAALAPIIAVKFSTALAAQAPFIAIQFAIGFVKDGIPAIVNGFIDEFKKAIGSLGGILGGGGGGGFLGDAVKSVTKVFGFADGGTPQFTGGDNLLAGFNAKELVVDKTDTQRLSRFLDHALSAQGQGSGSGSASSGGQGGPINQPIVIQIGQEAIARVMLNVRRDGFRV